jgi:hypothetical protein
VREVRVFICLTFLSSTGCLFGPHTLEKSHGEYNEAFRRVDSEELLLNIVRLRYNDSPAEVEVSAIAAQYELSATAEARPFFAAEAARFVNPSVYGTFTTVLPFVGTSGSTRPTLSLTPVQSGETVVRYLRPITLDGLVLFAETSWPISMIFRMWLEGMNGIPNAPSASGPTRSFAPEYAQFRRATDLLQIIQDREELTFRNTEEDLPGDPIAVERVGGESLIEAQRAGQEYRLTPDKKAWQLIRKVRRLYLNINSRAFTSPEYQELVRILNLQPGLTRYEVIQSTVGFIERNSDAEPSDKITLVPRSLIQVVYYLSNGVEVPNEHLTSGVAKATFEPDGRLFDWQNVTGGLFDVKTAYQKKPPCNAAVAVKYRGYWFYIDDADQATKSTFLLLRPSRHLDVGGSGSEKRSPGPVLTLPVGR